MELAISGRHVQVTEAMERHVQGRVDRLPRLDDQITGIRVMLAKDSRGQRVEVVAKCHKTVLVANATSHDMYASIDESFEKLEHQIARCHDKLVRGRAREAHKAAESAKKPQ